MGPYDKQQQQNLNRQFIQFMLKTQQESAASTSFFRKIDKKSRQYLNNLLISDQTDNPQLINHYLDAIEKQMTIPKIYKGHEVVISTEYRRYLNRQLKNIQSFFSNHELKVIQDRVALLYFKNLEVLKLNVYVNSRLEILPSNIFDDIYYSNNPLNTKSYKGLRNEVRSLKRAILACEASDQLADLAHEFYRRYNTLENKRSIYGLILREKIKVLYELTEKLDMSSESKNQVKLIYQRRFDEKLLQKLEAYIVKRSQISISHARLYVKYQFNRYHSEFVKNAVSTAYLLSLLAKNQQEERVATIAENYTQFIEYSALKLASGELAGSELARIISQSVKAILEQYSDMDAY
ncbi:unnamed protein product, partial [marine sediment metagenome]